MNIKNKLLLIGSLISCTLTFSQSVYAEDLLTVYQAAQTHDPIFQQAIDQRLVNKEGVPITAATLLPQIAVTANPSITRSGYSGTTYQSQSEVDQAPLRNQTFKSYVLQLSLTQTLFDFTKYSAFAKEANLSKSADATLNAAIQDLMIRVATAYFAVLEDEDMLIYSQSTKLAFGEQLHQMQQQYKVGLKTQTDVYVSEAAYDLAVSDYISTQSKLANDRENLRLVTGHYYSKLKMLNEKFPLVKPMPANIEAWSQTTLRQNWQIKAEQYAAEMARENIKQQFAGHLPTVDVQASATRSYNNVMNTYVPAGYRNGAGTETDKSIGLAFRMPIFNGGGVIAKTNQAKYQYQLAQDRLDFVRRSAVNDARQNYMNVIAGVSKITADKQAIKSNLSSLKGLRSSYQVGLETLVNVLNQQQKAYEAQTKYAHDRYAFVMNLLKLKQAAGILNFDDLKAINTWLINRQNIHFHRRNFLT